MLWSFLDFFFFVPSTSLANEMVPAHIEGRSPQAETHGFPLNSLTDTPRWKAMVLLSKFLRPVMLPFQGDFHSDIQQQKKLQFQSASLVFILVSISDDYVVVVCTLSIATRKLLLLPVSLWNLGPPNWIQQATASQQFSVKLKTPESYSNELSHALSSQCHGFNAVSFRHVFIYGGKTTDILSLLRKL